MKISFVILTWNRYKFLEKCLEALIESIETPNDCEIIIMDNGSTDGTRDVLNRYQNNKLVKVILRKKNYGLNAYKKLFGHAKGEYVVIVDDDVLTFPEKLDTLFIDYMQTFTHYGFIALNVIQNEFTNGAKPGPECYTEEIIGDKVLQEGPTGGWCACFRKREYKKLWLKFMFTNLNMRKSEDGVLAQYFQRKLGLKSGIIKNAVCFHATGPYYARQYGHMDREIEKYKQSKMQTLVLHYEEYKD
ncbi:glycosyltransferase family 2 protein [Mucilaginibacter sp.]|jgi:glycosyltransferase involved in cell wall biosynthesis|uniref:glycosyltransferase family 2 protein n=1 Tax=Mucilaginibacter sp. TaxID=1882438 RepID=UPI0035672237